MNGDKIRRWLKQNEPAVYSEFVKDIDSVSMFRSSPRITSKGVERAITDAETLIHSSGATSGVDRIHTTLHGYMLADCATKGLNMVMALVLPTFSSYYEDIIHLSRTLGLGHKILFKACDP